MTNEEITLQERIREQNWKHATKLFYVALAVGAGAYLLHVGIPSRVKASAIAANAAYKANRYDAKELELQTWKNKHQIADNRVATLTKEINNLNERLREERKRSDTLIALQNENTTKLIEKEVAPVRVVSHVDEYADVTPTIVARPVYEPTPVSPDAWRGTRGERVEVKVTRHSIKVNGTLYTHPKWVGDAYEWKNGYYVIYTDSPYGTSSSYVKYAGVEYKP